MSVLRAFYIAEVMSMQRRILVILSFIFTLSVIPPISASEKGTLNLPDELVTGGVISNDEDISLLTPGTVSVVKPDEVTGEQKNLPELLKQVPGLHVIEAKGRGAYTVASVRGSTAAEVSVFVDGMLMNLGSEAAVDISTIPTDNVERIEVYRGYIPARFAGASMGGVINIVTKKTESSGGHISAGAGSYGKITTNLSYAMPIGSGNFLFGANCEKSDGDFKYWNDNNTPYTPEDDYEATRRNNWYRNTDVLMKWNDDKWSIRGGWKKNERDLPYQAPQFDKPDSPNGAYLNTSQFDLSAMRRFKSASAEWGLKIDYLHQDKKYDDPENVIGGWGEQHNEYITDRFACALDGTWDIGKNHMIEFLADFSDEKLNARGDIVSTFGGISDFSRETSNIQIQDTIALDKAGTLSFTPIIRWNWWDQEGKFSFGAALNKELKNGWSVRITGGTYNRAPNLYELYGDGAFVRPNPDLQWEDGTQWDVGVTWKGKLDKADISATLTYFGRRSSNLIEFIMISPRYGKYMNIGEAEINGIEFEAGALWRGWKADINVTWMDAKNTSSDYRNGKPLPNRPEWEGLLRITRELAFNKHPATAFAELNYTGGNYYDGVGTICMDDLLTVGFGFKCKLSDKTDIVLGVDDIFNKSPDTLMYAVYNGPARTMWYPIQGRTLYATITWNF